MSYPKLCNVQNYTQVPFDGDGDEEGSDNKNLHLKLPDFKFCFHLQL